MSADGTAVESVDGDVVAVEESALARRVRRIPVAGAVLEWEPVRHAASARRLGALLHESARFAAADVFGLSGVRRYHLRRGGRPVLLRHGTDAWPFLEIFALRLYEPPEAVGDRLERAAAPLVLDLGANIGLFGLDLISRYPEARIMAFEPDAENAAIHRRLLELNAAGEQWQLVQACAGSRDGTVSFLPGQQSASRIVHDRVPGSVDLPIVDVMPLIADADLVKIDIEGGEWPLLTDPRFGAARSVILEYHTHGCPSDDPATSAREILQSHGFEVTPVFHDPAGIGMLWATRQD